MDTALAQMSEQQHDAIAQMQCVYKSFLLTAQRTHGESDSISDYCLPPDGS